MTRLKNSNMKKNVIWNIIGVFTLSLTSFVYSFILTKFCNLSVTGIWSYAFAMACTMTTLASFGGRTFQVTDVKGEVSTYTYVSSRKITVLIALLLTIIITLFKGDPFSKSLIIILLCSFKFFEELSDVYYGILQKHDKLYVVGQSLFLKSVVNMVIFLISILLFNSLLISVCFILLNNFLFFYFFDRKKAKELEAINKKVVKSQYIKYIKSNLVICLILFLSTYLVNCSKYVMSYFLSDRLQGIYNILILPATAITLVGNFIINPILVSISVEYSKNNIKKIKKASYCMIGIILICGIITIFAALILAKPVYDFIFNFAIENYMKEFIIIILGCVFYTICTVLTSVLITTRVLVKQLIVNIILVLISYFLCFYLINNKGLLGASYGYLITMTLKFIIYLLLIAMLKEKTNEKRKNT